MILIATISKKLLFKDVYYHGGRLKNQANHTIPYVIFKAYIEMGQPIWYLSNLWELPIVKNN